MEFKFTFLPEFEKCLNKLPKRNQKQIVKKIKMLNNLSNSELFKYIKPLIVPIDLKTHRLRVGEYRIFIGRIGSTLEFQNIDNRKDAYKK